MKVVFQPSIFRGYAKLSECKCKIVQAAASKINYHTLQLSRSIKHVFKPSYARSVSQSSKSIYSSAVWRFRQDHGNQGIFFARNCGMCHVPSNLWAMQTFANAEEVSEVVCSFVCNCRFSRESYEIMPSDQSNSTDIPIQCLLMPLPRKRRVFSGLQERTRCLGLACRSVP